MGDGETIHGGGTVTTASCRQRFEVINAIVGDASAGERTLDYGFVEKTDAFPGPTLERAIPTGEEFILLLGDDSRVLKGLINTPGNRAIVIEAVSKAKRQDKEQDPGRYKGKKNLIAQGGGSHETETAVLLGLNWLSRHQNEDGSWSAKGYVERCGQLEKYKGNCKPHGVHASIKDEFDEGLTGLVLLAFLGAGYTHTSRDTYDGINFGDVVRQGLHYLFSSQDRDGCVGPRTGDAYLYNHTIAALALMEAYGISGSNKIKDPAERAFRFLVEAQIDGEGWGNVKGDYASNMGVTSLAIMTAKAAQLSGLKLDFGEIYDGPSAWLNEVSFKGGPKDNRRWMAGYQAPNESQPSIKGVNDKTDPHPGMTAAAALCRVLIDQNKKDEKVVDAVEVLSEDLPEWKRNAIDYHYWHVGSLFLYQFDGPEGPKWRAWNRAMVEALVKNQNRRRRDDKYGSWVPMGPWSNVGGRVYATAINTLTLEVYYRYASVFNSKKTDD